MGQTTTCRASFGCDPSLRLSSQRSIDKVAKKTRNYAKTCDPPTFAAATQRWWCFDQCQLLLDFCDTCQAEIPGLC